MADTYSATPYPSIAVYTDSGVNPYFRLTVIEALAQIYSKPVGKALIDGIDQAAVAAKQAGDVSWKVRIQRPNKQGTIGSPGIEGGSRALGQDESQAKGGAGTQGYCFWNPNIYNTPNGARPAFIGLAHELIHCLHMVTGTMKHGYDNEERFTVGLAEYAGVAITENTIRAEHNIVARTQY